MPENILMYFSKFSDGLFAKDGFIFHNRINISQLKIYSEMFNNK